MDAARVRLEGPAKTPEPGARWRGRDGRPVKRFPL